MDPLSDLLDHLKPLASVSSGFEARGDWSLRFTQQQGWVKCYVILEGAGWLAVDGVETPVRLERGDAFVLPSGRSFLMASDLSLSPIDAKTVFPPAHGGGVVGLGEGELSFALAGARFAVQEHSAARLLEWLPPILHLAGGLESEALGWSVQRMRQEMREGLPGSGLMTRNLAHMMLLQALRAYLSSASRSRSGLLAALADPRLRRALEAMHEDPASPWTVQTLGAVAAMSRTAFAVRFREVMGRTPLQYLTDWRMALACRRLESTDEPLIDVAQAVGYTSMSAFSVAFKRVLGCAPQRYRNEASTLPR